jgi:hypothetical protein
MALEVNLQTKEHAQTAREFLVASDREFEAGDHLQASEKLWGAASHALIAVAQQRNLPHGSHRALKTAAQLLVDETGDMALLAGFLAAQKFHANFYHDFMEDFDLDADRPTVKDFVDRLMALSA